MINREDNSITLEPGEYDVNNGVFTRVKIFPGIYPNMTNEEYHGDKNSISRSSIMDFKKSPRKYWANHLNPNRPPKEVKESWEFGTAFHTFILEPHLFFENYFIMPRKVLKRENEELFNAYKEAEKEAENHQNKIMLSWNDYERLLAMQSALFRNERAKELIEGAVYECSFFWENKESGLMVKARPDILHPKIYIDLKTITDASEHAYQREMALYGYHIQAAMMEDAVLELKQEKLLACINICVEKNYPHGIGIYIIDEEAIKIGRKEYKSLLLDLSACIINNEWNDFEPATVGLPGWYV